MTLNILITGGAGFIGRWTVKKFLDNDHSITVLDNLSNGSRSNIEEFNNNKNFKFIEGDILDKKLLDEIFSSKIDICIHLAAMINVHESLENPKKCFDVNVIGTQYLLDICHKSKIKFVLMHTWHCSCCFVWFLTVLVCRHFKPIRRVGQYLSLVVMLANRSKSRQYALNIF